MRTPIPSIWKRLHYFWGRGFPFTLSAFAWRLKTAAFKQAILWQERFNLYSYQRWIKENEPEAEALCAQRERVKALAYQPTFSFLVLEHNGKSNAIQHTLASLAAQTYPRWEALISPYSPRGFDVSSLGDSRFRLISSKSKEPPFLDAAHAVQGEFIIVLYAGDMVSPNLLAEVVERLNQASDLDVLYTDEDQIEDGQGRQHPFFKPDWSPELMLSINYLCPAVIRHSLFLEAAVEGHHENAYEYGDLLFRCIEKAKSIHHIPQVLYHRGQAMGIAATKSAPYADQVEAHLHRIGLREAKALFSPAGNIRIVWPTSGSKISIIIPTRDRVDLLRKCVTSIKMHTSYRNYEFVLVDTGSVEPNTHQYYAELNQCSDVRLVYYQGAFNFSAALNMGVQHAQGEALLFLNNDTEAIEAEWLEEMLRWAERPEIGVVGALLLYPNGKIQHAGIILGMEGHASHVFSGVLPDRPTPFGSVNWYRNYSAVTGACMMMRRQVFEELGGFDENYELAFSDVEICQRAIDAGYRVVYTPYARLIHYEGKTRFHRIPGKDIHLAYLQFKDRVEKGDPFYNPHLSYAVRIPTLRRTNEPPPATRLAQILKFSQDVEDF